MRKLASIQKIVALLPIEGADFIEEAQVMGWRTVVKKGAFQVNDFCLFLEVDAICPEAPWSVFLRSRRIKTMKLKGVLSQGLTIPIKDVWPEGSDVMEEGQDVTEALGVTKYDPEIYIGANGVRGVNPDKEADFPSHLVPKTDEERVQSSLRSLEALTGRPYVATLKIDGSSLTALYDGDDFRVCSRNFAIKPQNENHDNYWKVALRYKLDQLLKGTPFAIQGELAGPGIQKNRLNLKEHDFFVFSIYNFKTGEYFKPNELKQYCEFNNLKYAPFIEFGVSFGYDLETVLERAKGLYPGTQNRREGLVWRSNDHGPRVSFKSINNDFLLKDEE